MDSLIKKRGQLNEYENNYQGFKFMPDSDGKTRFMYSDGSIKIRNESGIFNNEENVNDDGNNGLRRSTRLKVSRCVSYEFLNIRSRIIRKSELEYSKSSPVFSSSDNNEEMNKSTEKVSGCSVLSNESKEEGNNVDNVQNDQKNKSDELKLQKRQNDCGIEDSDNERSNSITPLPSSGSNQENRAANTTEELMETSKEASNVFSTTGSGPQQRGRGRGRKRRQYLEGQFIAEKILDERGGGKSKEYLIQWSGYSDQTWEWASRFQDFTKLINEFKSTRKDRANSEDIANETNSKGESSESVNQTTGRRKRGPKRFSLMNEMEYQAKRLKVDRIEQQEVQSAEINQSKKNDLNGTTPVELAAPGGPPGGGGPPGLAPGAVEPPVSNKRRTRGKAAIKNKNDELVDNLEKEKNQIESEEKKNEATAQRIQQAEYNKFLPELKSNRKKPGRKRGSAIKVSTTSSTSKDVEMPELVPETPGQPSNSSAAQVSGTPSIPDEHSGDEIGQTILKKKTNFAITYGAIPSSIIRMRVVEAGKEPELLVKYQGDQLADEWVPLSVFTQSAHQNLINQFIFKFLFKVCNLLRDRGIDMLDVAT